VKPVSILRPAIFGALFAAAPGRAHAHLVNTNVGEFYAGMVHPLTSAEHLLPTVALGLLAGQCGKQAARWSLAAFPMALVLGILVGSRFTELGFVHFANLAALVLLGVLLIVAQRVSTELIVIVAVLIGLILGYRSGVDMAVAKVGYQFIPGVALTGLIVVALFAAWIPEASSRATLTLRALCGVALAVTGVAMLLKAVSGADFHMFRGVGLPTQEDLVSLVKVKDLSLPIVLGALSAAVIWGAGHALTPGHGKAIVAAYLVGSRSTPVHAVFLGLIVTLTHTLGVLALGLVALFASRYLLAEQIYPWLGALSGLIVVVIGAAMLMSRIRPMLWGSAHDHGHSHQHHHHHDHGDDQDCSLGNAHDDDEHGHLVLGHSHLPPGTEESPVTWRSLLGLGISGGLVPCPSALVLLLAAISLGRVGLGMALVVAFSLGLAVVLTTVGLLFVKGSRIIQRIPQVETWGRLLPVASAFVIFVIGVIITAGSVSQIIA